MADQDWPITGVVVVADITKCPAGYTTIDRTFDNTEEADLWRDGLFGRRVTRYLCVERSAPQPGKDVLVDVTIINERDPVPAGFTVVDYTADTREKAIKKKVMCVRWMNGNLTTSAISELIILTKGVRRPPNGYTLVGELNNLMLCYKMAQIKTQSDLPSHNSDPAMNMSQLENNLPYTMHPQRQYSMGTRTAPPERTTSSLSATTVTPLTGIQWQLNPQLQGGGCNIHIPTIRYKTMMDIENEYKYHFNIEKGVTASSG